MGEMSELYLGFSASDMFCRDLDAAMRDRPFVSSAITGEEEEYCDRMPEIPRRTDLLEPANTPVLNRFALPSATENSRKVGKKIMNNNPTKVITGKCRISYEHIWEAVSIDDKSPAKFSVCALIRKDDEVTLKKFKQAVELAIQDGIKSKWKGKKPAKLKLPLRDGDEERPDDEAFAGCYFFNANANRQPGIVDLALNPILDREEVYSGCYCRLSVNLYPFSTNGNNGVAVGLNNVQKVSDGERLAGGSRAEDDFNDDFTDPDDEFDGIL